METDNRSKEFNLHILANLKAVIHCIDNHLNEIYENHDDASYETSCIGIEYCSLLVFVSTIIGVVTRNIDEEQIRPMTDAIHSKLIDCFEILKQSYNDEIPFDVTTCINRRTKDYEKIFFGNYEPCGYYLSKDYPRYKDNQLQDGLMRCCVAFGDFSIFLIKNHYPAEFEDIDPIILLDIFEMSFYSDVFIFITNVIFKYYNTSIEISEQYWNLAKPISTAPTEKNASFSKNENSTEKLFLVFAIILIFIFIVIYSSY